MQLQLGLLSVIAAALIASLRLGVTPWVYAPVDFGVYRNIGAYVLSGESLYGQLIHGPLVHGLPFVYTPFAALVMTPLNWFPAVAGLWLWTFLNAWALVGMTAIALRARGGVAQVVTSPRCSSA